MAHHNDFDGVYFSIQALRLYQFVPDLEIVVVDNTPNNPQQARLVNLCSKTGTKYVPFNDVVGTAVPRNRVFQEATGDVVVCIDCHVMLIPDALRRLHNWYASNPDSKDLVTGPIILDNLAACHTHFDLQWREEMWGTWASAWNCKCGRRFTVQSGQEGLCEIHDLMQFDKVYDKKCDCGAKYPQTGHAGHELVFLKAGFTQAGNSPNSPVFEIPAQGLGLFACRRDAWLGFNPHMRGFGGEEGYIHEKYRQAGQKCLSLPFLGWVHRFGNSAVNPRQALTWDKIRNYVLGFTEIGRPFDEIYQHFVEERKKITNEQWNYLLADPIGHFMPETTGTVAGCGGCGVGKLDSAMTLGQLFANACSIPSAINEHLPKLHELALQVDSIIEVGGGRMQTTVAFLDAQPKLLRVFDASAVPMDLVSRKGKTDLKSYTNTLETGKPEECDLLFIDDEPHNAPHVWELLNRHGVLAKRWIVLHDTTIFGEVFNGQPGIMPAVRRFVTEYPTWTVIYHSPQNHGLTVLGCQDRDRPPLPSLPKMAWNYGKALVKHKLAGSKLCSEEGIKERMAHCSMCQMRSIETLDGVIYDRCSVCGCYLNEAPDNKEGKLLWADSICPIAIWTEETKQ
jgi:hypothetical protein